MNNKVKGVLSSSLWAASATLGAAVMWETVSVGDSALSCTEWEKEEATLRDGDCFVCLRSVWGAARHSHETQPNLKEIKHLFFFSPFLLFLSVNRKALHSVTRYLPPSVSILYVAPVGFAMNLSCKRLLYWNPVPGLKLFVSNVSRCAARFTLSARPVAFSLALFCLALCGKVRRVFHMMCSELNLTVIRSYTAAKEKVVAVSGRCRRQRLV